MAMVYLAVGFGFMLAGGLLFGGIFFGLHPMVTLSGTTVGVWHGLGLIAARLPVRAGGHVVHRLAGAALQHASPTRA